MSKDIQNQSDVKEIFSSLKSTLVQGDSFNRYLSCCKTAPDRTSAILWPWYIAYERWKRGYSSRHDSLRNFILQLVLDGNMIFSDGHREIKAEAGTLGVIPPGTNQISTGSAGFCETVCMVFNGTALDTILNNIKLTALTVISPVPESFLHSMRHLIDMQRAGSCNPIDISAESCRIVLETSELIHKRNDLPESLSLALHYMRIGISDKLTMDMLLRNAHCTRQELQKLFRIHFNETPFEHFGKMRLEAAAEFLQNSRLSIKEISMQCGFKSQLYFSTAFRKQYGIPPRQFREEFQTE